MKANFSDAIASGAQIQRSSAPILVRYCVASAKEASSFRIGHWVQKLFAKIQRRQDKNDQLFYPLMSVIQIKRLIGSARNAIL